MDTHIDMTESTSELADRLARDSMFRAICDGDPQAMLRLEQSGSAGTEVSSRYDMPIGQRQVQSLLCFMVSSDVERSMEDAEGDNVVYDGLGEHRVLGKAKKKKKVRRSTY